MAGFVEVNPDGLAAFGQQLAALAEQVRSAGDALTVVGRPILGGTNPSHDLGYELARNAASTATWVVACGSALRLLAQAAMEAAEAYRTTEVQTAQRFAAMAAAFDEFDEMPGLLTDPA